MLRSDALDDRKRDVTMSFKGTERMRDDLARLADSETRSPSDILYWLVRQILYGEIVRLDALASGRHRGSS